MGWDGGGAVGRSQTRPPNRTENALGLPLRCEAEAATASSPTLRPRREVLPPSESTHARDHATFSEDPCGPICGSRASISGLARGVEPQARLIEDREVPRERRSIMANEIS